MICLFLSTKMLKNTDDEDVFEECIFIVYQNPTFWYDLSACNEFCLESTTIANLHERKK